MPESKKELSFLWAFLTKRRFYLVVFFLELTGLDLVFRFAYRGYSITGFRDGIPLLFTFFWAVLLTGAAWLLPSLVKKIYIGAITLVYCILTLVHCGMFSFFGDFFSFSDIKFAGDGADFFHMEYIHIRKLVIAAVVLCVLAAVIAILLVPKEKYDRARVIASLLMILLPVAGILAVRSRIFSEDDIVIWDTYQRKSSIYENFTDSAESLMLTGLYQYTFRDFCMSFGIYDLLESDADTIARLDAYYAAKEPDPDNDMTGLFAGKNLILIQLEAIDTWMLNEDCMPALYAIKQDSIDFVNHYTPAYIAAGTFNTESIVNSGLISPFTGGATSIYSRNSYPLSLPHLFREAGYSANSFHNSSPQTYNRGAVHENWGYEDYHSGVDIGMEFAELDSQLISGYDLMVNPDGNFFTFIITISGHGPYEDSYVSGLYYDKFAPLFPEDTNPAVIHAYAHAYETDLFIGALMERLESDGYLENTVVAFYADHYNYYVLNDELIMQIKEIHDMNMIRHTPFFIYSKDTRPRQITKVTGSIDVLPTLANLFGLDTDGRYYVGNDAFSDNGGYVIFKDYSWYDGERYWNSASDPADGEEVLQINEEIRERLNASWDTMNSNYFAHMALIRSPAEAK